MDRRAHWNTVFSTKGEQEVSWFESLPEISLAMLKACGLTRDMCVVDVGGGDSHLIDQLVADGLECLVVLDISGSALERARARLGGQAAVPIWLEADVTSDWSLRPMDIWHDRAVFHFLVDVEDRERYRTHLQQTLKPGGWAIVATFASDGPERCSGLPVRRYSPEMLDAELGPGFERVETRTHTHQTPWGATQSFQYSRFRRLSAALS